MQVWSKAQGTTQVTNETTMIARAYTALGANATFLALGSPTNADAVLQVQRLTRQVNALVRFELGELDDITGT